MNQPLTLQDAILNEVITDKVPVTLFLMNGFQRRGTVTGFDGFVVVLVSDGKQQMIYKHAISTLAPIRPLKSAKLLDEATEHLLRRLLLPFGRKFYNVC